MLLLLNYFSALFESGFGLQVLMMRLMQFPGTLCPSKCNFTLCLLLLELIVLTQVFEHIVSLEVFLEVELAEAYVNV